MNAARIRAVAAALLFAWSGFTCAQTDAYLRSLKPQGYVSDFAGVMSASERGALESVLAELERKTGAQVAVAVVRSMRGGQVDDFANRLYEHWGIGDRRTERGVLLFASLEERQVRLETGYGLEGLLPDARCGRILDESVIPHFRGGQFGRGLTQGALAVARIIASDAGVALSGLPAAGMSGGRPREESGFSWLHVLFLIVLIPLIVRHPWLLLLFMGGGRGGRYSGSGGGFGSGFGGFGGGLSGGGGASRGW